MEFADVVRKRRMVRSYDPERIVKRDVLETILNLAIRAPSAGHTQGWAFLVLDDITSRSRFWATTSDGPPDAWRSRMAQAPVLVLCLSDKNAYLERYAEPDKGWSDKDESRWPVPYWDVDTGMASMIMLLAIVDTGLAGCFFGVPPERADAVHEAFSIPPHLTIVGVVSIGYAAPDRRSPSLKRGRRGVDEVVHYGSFDPPAS